MMSPRSGVAHNIRTDKIRAGNSMKSLVAVSGLVLEKDVYTAVVADKEQKCVSIPHVVRVVNKSCFERSLAKRVALPIHLQEIRNSAFYHIAVREVHIPKNVSHIKEHSFEFCDFLQTVTFAQGSQLKSIGSFAFSYCDKLKNISFPNGLEEIGFCSFSDSGLMKVTIPDSIKKVEDNAFPKRACIIWPDTYAPKGLLTANMVRDMLCGQ